MNAQNRQELQKFDMKAHGCWEMRVLTPHAYYRLLMLKTTKKVRLQTHKNKHSKYIYVTKAIISFLSH